MPAIYHHWLIKYSLGVGWKQNTVKCVLFAEHLCPKEVRMSVVDMRAVLCAAGNWGPQIGHITWREEA